MRIDALETARKVSKIIREHVSNKRAYQILKKITLFHRIQASPGLMEAVEEIEKFIIDKAPDLIEISSFTYTGKAGPEWLVLPAHWSVYDAWLEINGVKYTLEEHPTLAAAHTPGSDGVIEGKVTSEGDPLDPSRYEKEKDKIHLIAKHHRIAYRLAAEAGVPAVILADESKHHSSFPYIGLFLSQEEASKYQTLAVTVPWKIAEGLDGKSVRLRIDADLGGPGQLPILVAWIGDRNQEGPSLIAHLCHPKPGANDNASGSAAAVEAFIAIAKAIEDNRLKAPESTIRLILVPEYTGTFLSMEGWLKNLSFAGINLDMVGRRDPYSPNPRLLYTPITVGRSVTGDTFYDAGLSFGLDIDIAYYMAGSDHDVYLAYGKDAIMYNQWPDEFYHTDSDEADTISLERVGISALLAATTAYLRSSSYEPTDLAPRILLQRLVLQHVSRDSYVSARLATVIASFKYGVKNIHYSNKISWSPVRDERVIRAKIPLYTGSLTALKSLEDRISLTRDLERVGLPRDILYEIFLAGSRRYTVKTLHTELASIHGVEVVTEEKIMSLLDIMEEHGLIELTS